MLTECQDDFRWLLRSRSGYYSWLAKKPYEFIRQRHWHCHMCERGEKSAHSLFRDALDQQFIGHPLLDIFFKALIRAEARFISRYVPQRSNEERLTGHLVSETDNSISVLRQHFKTESRKRYDEERVVDFLYYDLSRGGRIEKISGADLGFIIIVDLPDYPYLVKSFVFQAKKISGHCQIEVAQFKTLASNDTGSAYLFYDMDTQTRTAPMVLRLSDYTLGQKLEEADAAHAKTFSVPFDEILDGMPFSLYLMREIENVTEGKIFPSFRDALQFFRGLCGSPPDNGRPFDGIVGIVSLGRPITFQSHPDFGLDVTL